MLVAVDAAVLFQCDQQLFCVLACDLVVNLTKEDSKQLGVSVDVISASELVLQSCRRSGSTRSRQAFDASASLVGVQGGPISQVPTVSLLERSPDSISGRFVTLSKCVALVSQVASLVLVCVAFVSQVATARELLAPTCSACFDFAGRWGDSISNPFCVL